jgi:PAS domain S-box-containing protein
LSLKTKIALAVTALFVAVVAAGSYFSLSCFGREFKAAISAQQFSLVRALADSVDDKIAIAQNSLVAVAARVPPGALEDADRAQALLDSQSALLALFDNGLFLITPAGKLIAESPYVPGRRGRDISFREWFQRTVASRKPYISNPYVSTHRPGQPAVLLTVPLFDPAGKLSGMMAGGFDLLGKNILAELSKVRIGKAGYTYLSDSNRILIMHPDRNRILKPTAPPGVNRMYDLAFRGFNGTGETVTSYGVPTLSSVTHLRTTNWILGANYPLAEAYGPLEAAKAYFMMAAVAGAALLLGLALLAMTRLLGPLAAMTRHVQGLPNKAGQDRLVSIGGGDEVGVLAAAFNDMVLDLDRERESLEESEERYRQLVENIPEAIAVHSEGRFVYVNPAGANLLGYASAVDFVGTPILDIISPEFRGVVEARVKQTQEEEKPTTPLELKLLRADGRGIDAEVSGIPFAHYFGKPATLIVIRDITARREAEEEKERLQLQLAQAQKMESIGQLAGGIAHDFNNILAAVVGYTDLLEMKMARDAPAQTYVDRIRASSLRAADLTKSLLAFSRRQVISPKHIDLNRAIHNLKTLLCRIIGENIEVTTALLEEPLTVFADAAQLEQVLMNLAVNAKDSMPDGGRLVLETGRVHLDEEQAHAFGLRGAGSYAVLSVSDTGMGMEEHIRQRVFEPFFTTKELGRGTGLGLSIVYGTVKQHNGHVTVYSEVGRGTTFKVYLPLTNGAAQETEAVKPFDQPPGGGETVLIAEDNADVRRLTKEVLEQFGYTVIEASDGEEALNRFQVEGERVQLAILDVIMPKKNGRDVYSEMLRIQPGMKALFTSGYPADLILKEGVLERGLDFLQKPAAALDLLRKVREILDRGGPWESEG